MTAILQIPYDNHIFPVLCIAVFLCRCGRHVYGNVLAVEDDRQRLRFGRVVIYVLQTVAVEKAYSPIVTTNLEENFDSAFERRFLYKIKFDKPDAAVRNKIWQQMIPELTDDDAKQLAATFDFSGGQIENIARKHSINMVLYGEQENMLDTLMEYGAAEKISSKRIRNRIGF